MSTVNAMAATESAHLEPDASTSACDVVLGPLIRCPPMSREERWKLYCVYFPFMLFNPVGQRCGVTSLGWKLYRIARWVPGYDCVTSTMAILLQVVDTRSHMTNMHNAWKLRSGHKGADCQAEGLKAAWISYANSFYVGTALAMTIAFALVLLGPSDFGTGKPPAGGGNWLRAHLYEVYMLSNVMSCTISAVGVGNTAAYLEACSLVPAAGYTEWFRIKVREAPRAKILAWAWYYCAVNWLFLSLACLVYGSSSNPALAVVAWVIIKTINYADSRDAKMRNFSAWNAETSPLRKPSEAEYAECAAHCAAVRAVANEPPADASAEAAAEPSWAGSQPPPDLNARVLNELQLESRYLTLFAQAELDLGDLRHVDDAAALAALGAPELGVASIGHRCRILAKLRASAGHAPAAGDGAGAGVRRRPLRHRPVRHVL